MTIGNLICSAIQRATALFAFFLATIGNPSGAAAEVMEWSDADFAPYTNAVRWNTLLILPNNNVANTGVASRMSANGNPGSYRQMTHTFQQPNATSVAIIATANVKQNAVFKPVGYEVASITFTYDLGRYVGNALWGQPGNCVGYKPLIFQDGVYYTTATFDLICGSPSTGYATNPGWQSYVQANLMRPHFVRLGNVGPTFPNFSCGAPPITLGYFTANSTNGPQQGTYVKISGIDNWKVSVETRACAQP